MGHITGPTLLGLGNFFNGKPFLNVTSDSSYIEGKSKYFANGRPFLAYPVTTGLPSYNATQMFAMF